MVKMEKVRQKLLFFDRELSWQTTALLLLLFLIGSLFILVGDQIKLAQEKKPLPSPTTEVIDDNSLLYFLPQEETYLLNQPGKLTVWLDTQEALVDAADILINYPVEKVAVLGLEKGDVFDQYPELDWQAGQITIRGIRFDQAAFSGQGKVATINFIPLQKGQLDFGFDIDWQNTLDSNIVESDTARDILGEAKNIQLTIED